MSFMPMAAKAALGAGGKLAGTAIGAGGKIAGAAGKIPGQGLGALEDLLGGDDPGALRMPSAPIAPPPEAAQGPGGMPQAMMNQVTANQPPNRSQALMDMLSQRRREGTPSGAMMGADNAQRAMMGARTGDAAPPQFGGGGMDRKKLEELLAMLGGR